MVIEYSVIYPAVNHDNPNNDPYIAKVSKQRSFNQSTTVTIKPSTTDPYPAVLENIFAGMNHGSGVEFPWFLKTQARSMSVGDVVAIFKTGEITARWFICDSTGWLSVNATQVQSWLDHDRKYGCCSFELHRWADERNIVHCMTEFYHTMAAEVWP